MAFQLGVGPLYDLQSQQKITPYNIMPHMLLLCLFINLKLAPCKLKVMCKNRTL